MSSVSAACVMETSRLAAVGLRNYNVRMKMKAPRSVAKRPARRLGKKLVAKLIRIGNSRGVRLPKALIEQVGLTEEVEIIVRDGELVIRPAAAKPRARGGTRISPGLG